MTLYKVAAVGKQDSVLAFKAIGIDTFAVDEPMEARKRIDTLAKDGYGLIFLTEQVASNILDTVERYKKELLPVIILVPGVEGSLGMGMDAINANVEKAVGSNILDNNE